MKIQILEKNEERINYLFFITKLFSIKWFSECDSWFIYIRFGRQVYRFSDSGFLKYLVSIKNYKQYRGEN